MEIDKLIELAQGLEVLIVEDEAPLRESFQYLLLNLFNSVDTAEDGQDALEKIEQKKYDIILTDLSMPRMSGLRLVDRIREQSQNQHVIAISAHDDPEFVEALAPFNVQLLSKPLEIDRLFRALEPICTQIRAERGLT
jgi:YesN/AraC family two-component response regulator